MTPLFQTDNSDLALTVHGPDSSRVPPTWRVTLSALDEDSEDQVGIALHREHTQALIGAFEGRTPEWRCDLENATLLLTRIGDATALLVFSDGLELSMLLTPEGASELRDALRASLRDTALEVTPPALPDLTGLEDRLYRELYFTLNTAQGPLEVQIWPRSVQLRSTHGPEGSHPLPITLQAGPHLIVAEVHWGKQGIRATALQVHNLSGDRVGGAALEEADTWVCAQVEALLNPRRQGAEVLLRALQDHHTQSAALERARRRLQEAEAAVASAEQGLARTGATLQEAHATWGGHPAPQRP